MGELLSQMDAKAWTRCRSCTWKWEPIAGVCVELELDVSAIWKGFHADVWRWKLLLEKFPWAVLSDEQMSNGWSFSLLNDEQMSKKVRVEYQPVPVEWIATLHFRIFARTWKKHSIPWLCLIPGLQRIFFLKTSWGARNSYPQTMVAQTTPCFTEYIRSCT